MCDLGFRVVVMVAPQQNGTFTTESPTAKTLNTCGQPCLHLNHLRGHGLASMVAISVGDLQREINASEFLRGEVDVERRSTS